MSTISQFDRSWSLLYWLESILGQGSKWWHVQGLSRWGNNYQGTADPIAVIKQAQYMSQYWEDAVSKTLSCRQTVAKSSAITKLLSTTSSTSSISSTSFLASITFEEASPTMSQWVKDKAKLRFGKTVTNGLVNWFRHRLRPADLKGTKVKNFRKRHAQTWKSCKALTRKKE